MVLKRDGGEKRVEKRLTGPRRGGGGGGGCRAEWGHSRIVGEGSGTGAGQGAERRLLNPESAPWERHTQRPFEVGDLGVAHPQLGHSFRQCFLLSGQEKPSPLPKYTPPTPPFQSFLPGRPLPPQNWLSSWFSPFFLPSWPLPPLGVERKRSEFGGTVLRAEGTMGVEGRVADQGQQKVRG